MDYYQLAAYAVAVAVVFMAVKVLFTPLKFAFYVVYYAIVGGLVLWGINVIGALVGLHLPLNPVAAFLSGYLGVPGILLVYALQRILT
ncbi:MAG: pro-sigmaK processing inhibitor BofA [Firmicutes bacterium]|nr:pro-sigmaK processing inhibitor BofA [Bacillota bacterium]